MQKTSITKYTKYYYIGTERIASALGTMNNLGLLCENNWPGDQMIVDEMAEKTVEAGDALVGDYLSFEKDLQLPEPYLYENYLPCESLFHEPANYDAYWYHPDHLGSSNYITNLDGNVSQHMEYLPFGETLVEEHLNSYNSPYKFNAKEFDAETGNYYYGARYYNPKWSIWLSVDPLASYDPVMETEFYGDGQHNGGFFNNFNLNSYIYTYQNPVRYIDPNGKQVDFNRLYGEVKETLTSDWNNRVEDWNRMKNDLSQIRNDINELTEISFTIWGENKAGDHKASKGVIDEKSPKKSIEVTGDDVIPLYTLLNKIFSSIRGEEEIDGYPVTSDESKGTDPYKLIKYSSNNDDKNVIWIDGASSMEEAKADSTKTMETTQPKNHRYSDTFGVDSLEIQKQE